MSRKGPSEPELLNTFVKGATEYALLLLCPEERVTYWNEGARRLFGYEESEILGRPVYDLFTPEDVELGVAHKEVAKAREQGWADDERWHLRKDGGRFWANGVVTALKNPDGNVIGFSKVLRDQTLRKETEDRLKSAVSELTQFNHVLSHDLQEPLRMVSGYLQLLKRKYGGKVGAEHDEFVAMATEGTQRVHAMLNDLLAYVRSDQRTKIERSDMAAIFDMAVSNLKVLIDETNATVTRTPLPIVEVAPTQLVQLLQNLIGNGIKYRRHGESPKVFVDVKEAGPDHWCFSVCDNGIGIPAEHRDYVFDAFRRLHSKDDFPGTGLGLYIAKTVIDRHGGKIWIESDGKTGTTVHFTLPRRLTPAEEQQSIQEPE